MFVLKRLLLLAASSITAVSPYIIYQRFATHEEAYDPDKKIENFLNLHDSLTGDQIKQLTREEIYKNNISSFAQNFIHAFAKSFIFEWSKKEQDNDNQSIKIALEKLKQEKFVKGFLFDNSNEENWKTSKLFSEFKSIFLEKVLKSFLLQESDGEIKIQETHKGKAYADFQKKALDLWISEETPFFTVEEKWSYSKKAPTLYNDNINKQETSSSYRFPDFEDNISDYKTLITKLKNNKFTGTTAKETVFTKSDFTNIQDGHLGSGLIYVFNKLSTKSRQNTTAVKTEDEKVQEINLNNGTFKDEYTSKPIYLFLDKVASSTSSDNKCVYIKKDIFNTTIQSKFASNDSCALSCIAKTVTAGNNQKTVHFIRHLSGVSAMYESSSTDTFNKKIVNQVKSEIQNSKLSDSEKKFSRFIQTNFERLLLSWLSEENKSSELLRPGTSLQQLLNNKELLKEISGFASTWKNNQLYYQALNNLTATSAVNSNTKIEKDSGTNSKVYLEQSQGLSSPLFLNADLDNTTQISEIKFDDTENDKWTTNDGSFSLLKQLFSDIKYDNLYKKVESLKAKITTYCNNHPENLKRNYIFNYIYNKFIENPKEIKRYISNLKMSRELLVNTEKHDFSQYVSNITKQLNSLLQLSGDKALSTQKITNIIYETFHLPHYQKTSLDKRLIFGGYKSSEDEQVSLKSSNVWKLKNHFFTADAYDISSTSNEFFLKHLYLILWMLKNHNMDFLFKKLIPNNKYAMLMWTDNIDATKFKSMDVKNETNLPTELNNIDTTYFKNQDILFHPFFNIKTFNSQTTTYVPNPYFFAMSAVAYKKGETYKNLYGFSGLQTPNYFHNFDPSSNKEINSYLKEAIFNQFNRTNPSENKNYMNSSTAYAKGEESFGSGFGINTSIPGNTNALSSDDIIKFFDSLHSKQRLSTFLQAHCPQLFAKISTNTTISDLDIDGLKQAIKTQLNADSKLARLFHRFSGVLQNPDAHQFSDPNKKYLLNIDAWKKEDGKVIFVTQVNQKDFTQNIAELAKIICPETIIKTLFLLSYNPESMQTLTGSN